MENTQKKNVELAFTLYSGLTFVCASKCATIIKAYKKSTFCLTKKLQNMFKLWCEWGMSEREGEKVEINEDLKEIMRMWNLKCAQVTPLILLALLVD